MINRIKAYKKASGVNNSLVLLVKSDNAGTSSSDQFTIPTSGSGYNYSVVTSDGYSASGLTGNHTITFPTGAGNHTVIITGDFLKIYFNNAGDKLKLLEIQNFGFYQNLSTSAERIFWGCSNLLITASDVGNFGDCVLWNNAFQNCSNLDTFPLIDTSSATNLQSAFQGLTSLLSFPLIDTSSATNFTNTWNGCSSIDSFPAINVSNGTNFTNTWRNMTSLSTFPANMFDSSTATNYSFCFTNTNLTATSIDNILISIDTAGQSGGTFNQSGGSAPTSTGETAIDNLRGKGWTITVTGGY